MLTLITPDAIIFNLKSCKVLLTIVKATSNPQWKDKNVEYKKWMQLCEVNGNNTHTQKKFFKSRFYKTHLGKSHIALKKIICWEPVLCNAHDEA